MDIKDGTVAPVLTQVVSSETLLKSDSCNLICISYFLFFGVFSSTGFITVFLIELAAILELHLKLANFVETEVQIYINRFPK